MGVCADDDISGFYQALFRQEGMLNPHIAYVKKVYKPHLLGKTAADHALLCSLNILDVYKRQGGRYLLSLQGKGLPSLQGRWHD